MKKFFFCISLAPSFVVADPWGKDADLCCRRVIAERRPVPKQCPTPFFGSMAEILIDFHQTIISPADGPRSHFLPSSSQYTLESMRTYGFYSGFLMGCDRLMRENSDPWVYRTKVDPASGKTMKIDPVP
ncbi:MAG: membrane protein insertion efficiency factor YidD [Parachlamydiaceae bacterium]|nr:membrane protein insertion efficiency factor YidD [Parachlamydiaceae bacterium]